jgi:hypothetical protein
MLSEAYCTKDVKTYIYIYINLDQEKTYHCIVIIGLFGNHIAIVVGNVKEPTSHATTRNWAKLGEVCTLLSYEFCYLRQLPLVYN